MYCYQCGEENTTGAGFCSHCGVKLVSDIDENVSQQTLHENGEGNDYIDRFKHVVSSRYEIIRELGRGGMAIVFLAYDKRLERKVALKLLPQEFSFDKSLSARFLREAKISAKLSHPNIIQIHDIATDDDFTYYTMSYIKGISLSQVIKKSEPLHPTFITKIGSIICHALQHAHDATVIHRDIKPDNIIIDQNQTPIVVDFGIAKALTDTKLSQTGAFIGTPQYMSPEQIKTGKVDGRSDIYSLGCVLYEMAVGEPPFHGLDQTALMYNQVNVLPPSPRTLNKRIPKTLSDIIMRALAKNPIQRFQSAGEFGITLHNTFRTFSGSNRTEPIPLTLANHDSIKASSQPETMLDAHQDIHAADVNPESCEDLPDQTKLMPISEKPGVNTILNDSNPIETFVSQRKAPNEQQNSNKSRKNILPWAIIYYGCGALLVSGIFYAYNKINDSHDVYSITNRSRIQPSHDTHKNSIPFTVKKSENLVPTHHTTMNEKMSLYDNSQPSHTNVNGKVAQKLSEEDNTARVPLVHKNQTFQVEGKPEVQNHVPQKQIKENVKQPEPKDIILASRGEIPLTEGKKPINKSPVIIWMKVIGGTFSMGDTRGDMPEQMKCKPVHRVTVSSCEMSRNEVTVEQYQVFLDATGHQEPPEWETQTNHPERPVVFVSWEDANAFADWAEARLPTEAEWEYSARGGLEGELYPWGSDEPDAQANFGHEWEKGNGWISSLKKPGSFSPNKFGLNDMSGNVWEWCHDWFGPYSEGTIVNPTGPEAGEKRVVRGGAWNSTATTIRTSVRGPQDPHFKGPHTGFRIVRDMRS